MKDQKTQPASKDPKAMKDWKEKDKDKEREKEKGQKPGQNPVKPAPGATKR